MIYGREISVLSSNNEKGLWANGVVLSFDLVVEELKQYFSEKAPQGAYEVIKKYLLKHGFEHLRDTDYKNEHITKYETVDILYRFSRENKWFPYCVRKLNISPNIITLDISEDIQALRDERWAEEHFNIKKSSEKQK